jgi:hypothetical protein
VEAVRGHYLAGGLSEKAMQLAAWGLSVSMEKMETWVEAEDNPIWSGTISEMATLVPPKELLLYPVSAC